MAGRPTLYKPEYVEKVKRICLLGGTDVQIADYFGVDVSTIGNWKNAHPEFLESIRETKVLQDLEVSDSLFKQARAGNVIAQKFWLMNRQKDAWREKQEVDLRTPNGIQISAIDATRLAGMSDEEIAQVREKMREAIEIAQKLQIEPPK